MIDENVIKMLKEIKRLTNEDYDSFMKAFIIYETNTDENNPTVHACADIAFCGYRNIDSVNILSDEIIEVMNCGAASENNEAK